MSGCRPGSRLVSPRWGDVANPLGKCRTALPGAGLCRSITCTPITSRKAMAVPRDWPGTWPVRTGARPPSCTATSSATVTAEARMTSSLAAVAICRHGRRAPPTCFGRQPIPWSARMVMWPGPTKSPYHVSCHPKAVRTWPPISARSSWGRSTCMPGRSMNRRPAMAPASCRTCTSCSVPDAKMTRRPGAWRGGVSKVEIDANNILEIKDIGVAISTSETLPQGRHGKIRKL